MKPNWPIRAATQGIALATLIALSGCISSSSPSPPEHNTTVVVPQGGTVCSDGTAPPCR